MEILAAYHYSQKSLELQEPYLRVISPHEPLTLGSLSWHNEFPIWVILVIVLDDVFVLV
jgi:hypothetical protein